MKRALITGASSGIGYATALSLHQQGWAVSGMARDFSQVEHRFMQVYNLDLSDIDRLPNELAALNTELPDCLILNAGRGLFGGLEQLSYTQIRQVVDLNLVSNLVLLKHFLPQLKQAGSKDIVIVGSEAALSGAKQASVYAATKFALRGLAQSLRADCVSADIRVMLVNPGPAATNFFDELHFEPKLGDDFALAAGDVAQAILRALEYPRNVVQEEINIQPLKRAFETKRA